MADPYTAIPNWLIEAMPQMPASTFQIACVIARQTVGYSDGNGGRREWDRISLTQFEKATGLTRQGVINAIEHGSGKWFQRRQAGWSFEYQLVNSVDQSSELTSQLSRPDVVNSVDQLDPEVVNSVDQQLVNSVDTQKKEIKERTKKKKRKESVSAAAPQDAPPTEQQKYFDAVCWIVGWDYHTLTKEDRGQVAQAVGVLRKAEYTLDDLRRFFLEIWVKDWRWEKSDGKQRPTLTQLRQEIGKLRASIPVDMPLPSSGYSAQGKNADIVDRAFARMAEKGIHP